MSNLLEWAKNEVKLAKAYDTNPDDFGYYSACVDSALKAYKSLTKDGHSGMSIGITKSLLNALIDGRPLTPLTGEDSEWVVSYQTKDQDSITMQNNRMSSVFKTIYTDGRVKYSDINRCVCVSIETGSTFSFGMVNDLLDEKYPITFPYIPSGTPYRAECDDFLMNPLMGDYDHFALLRLQLPDGSYDVSCKTYWREVRRGGFEVITEEEYKSDYYKRR